MRQLIVNFWVGLLLLTGLLIPIGAVQAQDVLDPVCRDHPEATVCRDNEREQTLDNNTIFGENGIITKAVRLVSIIVGVAAIIMIVVGGIQYVISAGDPTNVTNAKNTILYAIIGLIVALFAQAIIRFVLVRI